MALVARYYFVPMISEPGRGTTVPRRVPGIKEALAKIEADGGDHRKVELGGIGLDGPGWHAVKVIADDGPDGAHAFITGSTDDGTGPEPNIPGVVSVPSNITGETLIGEMNSVQKQALNDLITEMGYDPSDLLFELPNEIGTYKLRQVIKGLSRRNAIVKYANGKWNAGRLISEDADILEEI